MADPLSQLRQFAIANTISQVKEQNGYIIFGDHGWPKNVNTNYQIYSTEDDRGKKEYYSLECLVYFLKHTELAHQHYVKQAGSLNIPVVHRPDRKNILAYLKGDNHVSTSIDRNAPIPALRLHVSEILKKDQQNSNSTSTSLSSTANASATPRASTANELNSSVASHKTELEDSGDGPAAKRIPHDPEMEKKQREEFAARLFESKPGLSIPADKEKIGYESGETSAAIIKFGAEKLAALKAKRLGVKRTTIIDADAEVGLPGSSATEPSNMELLIERDREPVRIIRSKEKIWRNRTSILQAQSKNFQKTVLPLADLVDKRPPDHHSNRRPMPGQHPSSQPASTSTSSSSSHHMPPVPTDMQLNQHQQQQQHQSQQQNSQRNSYNRYDQEKFVKLDIGMEIDTKKSFVSGVANGLSSNYNSQTNSQSNSNSRGPDMTTASATNGSQRHDAVDSRSRSQNHHHQQHQKPVKRQSTVPIIIIPATTTSLINMYNASAILQDLTYIDKVPNKNRESEILIQRKKADGTHAAYKILDNPIKLDPDDWNRVVAVFVQGPAWQFKGWPWGGSPVEIFSRIKGFHLKWDEAKLDDNVAKWNVHILELPRNKRHLDKASLLKFWSSLDVYMMKYKSFLKF